jgi:cytidylate kinase
MGESPAETVREIEETRQRIDDDLDALTAALPPKDEIVTRLALGAAVGVVTVLGVWLVASKVRQRRQDARIRKIVSRAVQEAQSSPQAVTRETIKAIGEAAIDD